MFKGAALDLNQLNSFSDILLEAATRSPPQVMDKPAKSEVEVSNLQLLAAGEGGSVRKADYIVQPTPNALRFYQHRSV